MARSHYWQYLLNSSGEPIGSADISVYRAGTSTAVNVYASESGGVPQASAPQVTTDSSGFFEFWIDHDDFSSTQKFKIQWSKPGISTDSIDYVEIHQIRAGVDETNTNTTKNKLISNNLAKGWEDHKDSTYTTNPHGFLVVDETNTNTTKNKLISNNLAKGWEDHKDSTYATNPHGLAGVDETDTNTTKNKLINNSLAKKWNDAADAAALEVDETDTNTTKNKLVSNNLAKGWEDHKDSTYATNPHNIEAVDETDVNVIKNKLVSNNLAKGWEDHKDSIYVTNPHNIEAVDETDVNVIKNKLISNYLANLFHATALSAPEIENFYIPSGASWTYDGFEYYTDVQHNMENEYPVVQCYNIDSKRQIYSHSVESISPSGSRIYMSDNGTNINVVVVG